jgi:5-methylcytosine-specific restriction endonuclease McrA
MSPKAKRRLTAELVKAQGGVCFYCGRSFGKCGRTPTLDHKLPQWLGGTWDRRNLVAACRKCNFDKGPLDAETYMRVRDDEKILKLEVRKAHAMAREAMKWGVGRRQLDWAALGGAA